MAKDSGTLCFGPGQHRLSRSVGEPLPNPRARDWSPPPPTDLSYRTGRSGASPEGAPGHRHRLHEAVWLADAAAIAGLLSAVADIDEADERSATPLMLAVELLPRAPREYTQIVQQLLDLGADPRLRTSFGWSPLDVAVSRGDQKLVQTLFQGTQRSLERRWAKRLDSVAMSLGMLPDFECSIRWEFESPVVPLLHKLAPSDVVHLRKRGNSLRVDSTLASWKRFRLSKRRELTTLFRSGSGGARPSFCMINHSKQTVVDVTEGLDGDEADAVVEDLVSAEAVQWDMKLSELEVAEATSWLGSSAGPCEFNGWRTQRFEVKGTLGVVVRKKGDLGLTSTFQEYFGCPLPPDACLPEIRASFEGAGDGASASRQMSKTSGWSEADSDSAILVSMDEETMSNASEVLTRWPESQPAAGDQRDCRDFLATSPSDSFGQRPEQPTGGRARQPLPKKNDSTGRTSRSVSASVWLATDFDIPLEQFLPILEALSVDHAAIRQLQELLRSEGIAEASKRAKRSAEQAVRSAGGDPAGTGHVFPVRACVPLNMVIRALVHFESFRLVPPNSFPEDLFEVPEGYKTVPRREAQKTPNRAKKRMLLANLML